MDSGRIMKELRELQNSVKNVSTLNAILDGQLEKWGVDKRALLMR